MATARQAGATSALVLAVAIAGAAGGRLTAPDKLIPDPQGAWRYAELPLRVCTAGDGQVEGWPAARGVDRPEVVTLSGHRVYAPELAVRRAEWFACHHDAAVRYGTLELAPPIPTMFARLAGIAPDDGPPPTPREVGIARNICYQQTLTGIDVEVEGRYVAHLDVWPPCVLEIHQQLVKEFPL